MNPRTPMKFDPQGWLDSAVRIESLHHNERPCAVDALVLHNISLPPGEFGTQYIDALFLGQMPAHRHAHPYFDGIAGLRVSAHFYIARDGHIRQYVSIHRRAWHAGVSHYRGRDNCNDFSVGIEIAGTDHHPYTLRQYQTLARLTLALFAALPQLNADGITTHRHIAPERKTDPGPAFHMGYYRQLLHAEA